MLLVDEFSALLLSDVGSNGLDALVSQPGLWLRNTMIHAGFGFLAFFMSVYAPWATPSRLRWAFAGYVILQGVQLWSEGPFWMLVADGVFDIFVLLAGYFFGLWLGGQEVRDV